MNTFVNCIIAVATVAMFWIGRLSYKLSKQIHSQAEQQQKDFEDLLEAIVISVLISGPTSWPQLDDAIKAFKDKYKGKRQIFKDKT